MGQEFHRNQHGSRLSPFYASSLANVDSGKQQGRGRENALDRDHHLGTALTLSPVIDMPRLLAASTMPSTSIASIRTRIHTVLTDGSMATAFQPIYDLATGEVTGAEALTRFSGGHGPDVWFALASFARLSSAMELAAVEAALSAAGQLPEQTEPFNNSKVSATKSLFNHSSTPDNAHAAAHLWDHPPGSPQFSRQFQEQLVLVGFRGSLVLQVFRRNHWFYAGLAQVPHRS